MARIQDSVVKILRGAGIKPTRQRLILAELLFDGKDKHVTAEDLHGMVRAQKEPMALATIYNNLHQFTSSGLLRQVVVESGRVYFDTNTSAHHHFYDPTTAQLTDIPHAAVKLESLPPAPRGKAIDHVSVTIRLR